MNTMKAVGSQETQQEMIDHLEQENRQMLDAGLCLQENNAQLLAALGYVLDTMLCEWPDENDSRGSSPRNHIWCREAKTKARAAIKAATVG